MTYKVTAGYIYSGEKKKGYQLMIEDNTQESKRLEALELRERQKELESEMLRLEKAASEAANKAKSSFLAQMSHEIRTPLNAVIGMDEMIIRETSIIALTANAIAGAKEMYLSNGFDGYLTKPVGSAALEQLLISFLPESKISFTDTKPAVSRQPNDDTLTFDEIKQMRALCPQINIAAEHEAFIGQYRELLANVRKLTVRQL